MKSMFNKALVLALIVAGSVQAAETDKALAAFTVVAQESGNQAVSGMTDLAQDLQEVAQRATEADQLRATRLALKITDVINPVVSQEPAVTANHGWFARQWAGFKSLFSNSEAAHDFNIKHDQLLDRGFNLGYPENMSYSDRLQHMDKEGYGSRFYERFAARIKDMPANLKNAAMFVKENPLTAAGYAAAAYLAYEYALKPAYNKLFAKKAAQPALAKKAAVRS